MCPLSHPCHFLNKVIVWFVLETCLAPLCSWLRKEVFKTPVLLLSSPQYSHSDSDNETKLHFTKLIWDTGEGLKAQVYFCTKKKNIMSTIIAHTHTRVCEHTFLLLAKIKGKRFCFKCAAWWSRLLFIGYKRWDRNKQGSLWNWQTGVDQEKQEIFFLKITHLIGQIWTIYI